MAGRPTTQERALPACANSRQIARLDARRPVPDSVDPAIGAKQRALRSLRRISAHDTPAARSCARVTTPCWALAIRASSCSTVLFWGSIRTPRQDRFAIRPPAARAGPRGKDEGLA